MSFEFEGYTVRPVTERDRAYIERLIDEDEYHRGRMTADFFLKCQPGEDAWALEDQNGQVFFYFKTSTVVRVAIQFCPSRTRRENQTALIRGLRWLESILLQNRFTEMIFDTEGEELARFARRHLGFEDARLMKKMLSGDQERLRVVGSLPTNIEERIH